MFGGLADETPGLMITKKKDTKGWSEAHEEGVCMSGSGDRGVGWSSIVR